MVLDDRSCRRVANLVHRQTDKSLVSSVYQSIWSRHLQAHRDRRCPAVEPPGHQGANSLVFHGADTVPQLQLVEEHLEGVVRVPWDPSWRDVTSVLLQRDGARARGLRHHLLEALLLDRHVEGQEGVLGVEQQSVARWASAGRTLPPPRGPGSAPRPLPRSDSCSPAKNQRQWRREAGTELGAPLPDSAYFEPKAPAGCRIRNSLNHFDDV